MIAATGRYSDGGVRVCACWPARHSTAPMVNSATGLAASASMLTIVASGPASFQPSTEQTTPSAIDHGSGFDSAPCSARIERRARAFALGLVRLRQRDAHRAW